MPVANDKRYDSKLDQQCSLISTVVSLRTCLAFGMTNPRKNNESKFTGHIYDLVFDYKGHEIRVETELKKEWNAGWSRPVLNPDVPYKWPSMDVPYRKRDKAIKHANWHQIVGGDGKRAFWVPRRVLLDESFTPISEKWVRNRNCMEPFFNVQLPAPSSMFWEEIDGVWRITHRWDSKGNLVIKNGVRV